MNIRSIVNKEVATINNCESEPIHIPGSIQPHGFLLGVNAKDLVISYCSENCVEFLGKPHAELLGKNLGDIFNTGDIENIKDQFTHPSKELARPFIITYHHKSFHVTAHLSNQTIVLEFETFYEERAELPDIYIQMKRFAYYTERTDNLQSLCKDIADEVRNITGYDRVMIYCFDKEYNGEVFAESKTENLEPFLNLHYPHTDIPVQARELYLLNLVRMKVNVGYEPVPIYTSGTGSDEDLHLDLSMSSLRSVSPIHIQYLKNMNVEATLVVSLIHKDKLWGLITCHHYSPKHIPYHTRLAAHFQAIFLSSQIEVRQAADEFELTKETHKKLVDLQDMLLKNENVLTQKSTLEQLRLLVNADAVIVNDKDNLYTEGKLPDKEKLTALINWLKKEKSVNVFSTHCLARHYPAAPEILDTIAGIIYLPLGDHNKNCIVWTRHEVIEDIHWAGNPSKAILINEGGKKLTPRKSFEKWKEAVKMKSTEWKTPELNEANAIASSIQHQLHLSDLRSEEKRYLTLNEKLQKANDELANMNWISTHDLKEPLRKIQFYGSIILEREAGNIPDLVLVNIKRMQTSAAKMQILIDDLLTYSKVVNEERQLVPIDLNKVIREIIGDLQENIEDKKIDIQLEVLPIINGVQFQINQLFLNLLSNAVKFTRKEVVPNIKISCETVSSENLVWAQEKDINGFYKISVADNGIGFDTIYNEKVFKIFQRLNSNTEFTGTGIGLAICKKIAELQGGHIEADGSLGKGAIFSVFIPK